jgi:hypothetical protein
MASLLKDPAVLAKLQAKLGAMEGADSGYLETLPVEVTRRLKALKKLQASSVQVRLSTVLVAVVVVVVVMWDCARA